MNVQPKAVFVGLATVDVVYQVDAAAAANEKVAARSQQVYAGGPATNAAITFAHLGGEATLAAAVGRHPVAHVIHQELNRYGVRLSDLHPQFEEAPAISAVSVTADGRRSVVSANAQRIGASVAEADRSALLKASVLLLDGHQMRVAQNWAREARDCAVAVVMDCGSWKDGTDQLLRSVDVAICSADFKPPGCKTDEEIIDFLRELGVSSIAISHGAQAIRYHSIDSSGYIEVPQVVAVDTMGAGDVLHGAFCSFFARGDTFEEALRQSAQLASESCRFHGTRAWMEARGAR